MLLNYCCLFLYQFCFQIATIQLSNYAKIVKIKSFYYWFTHSFMSVSITIKFLTILIFNTAVARCSISILYLEMDLNSGIQVINFQSQQSVKVNTNDLNHIESFRRAVEEGAIIDLQGTVLPDIKVNYFDLNLEEVIDLQIELINNQAINDSESSTTMKIDLHLKIKPALSPDNCPLQNTFTPCIYYPTNVSKTHESCKSCLLCQNSIQIHEVFADFYNLNPLKTIIKKCIQKHSNHSFVRQLIQSQKQMQVKFNTNKDEAPFGKYTIQVIGLSSFLLAMFVKYRTQNQKKSMDSV